MNSNIIEKYLDYTKKSLTKYFKLVLPKLRVKDISLIIDKYLEIRYYNYYDLDKNGIKKEIRTNLSPILEEFKLKENLTNLVSLSYNTLLLDDILDDLDIKEILTNIEKIYFKTYNTNLDTKELKRLIIDTKSNKIKVLKEIKTDKFQVNYLKLANKLYLTNLTYNIKFPSIYSTYAINRVYESSLINEQKLFVLYNLVDIKILNEVINYNYKNKYILDFPITLFLKEDKIKRFFNLINNDIIKEKIVINLEYEDYLEYKDKIDEMIKLGYHFAITFKKKYEFTNITSKSLELFSFLITKKEDLYNYYSSFNMNIYLRSM